jgi:hypothetical protein
LGVHGRAGVRGLKSEDQICSYNELT